MVKKILKIVLIVILVVIIVRAVLVIAGFSKGAIIKGDKIAVIDFTGTIMTSDKFIHQLSILKHDSGIKGIILRVNSPGGAVTPSNEIYNYLINMGKPLYVSMGSVAASGGYMMSIAADKIYAEPSTITGSIGVIMNMANTQELFNKIGIKPVVLKSGKFKDIGNPNRPMTDEEHQLLMGVINDMYDQFVDMVSARRHIPKTELLKIADGRIFTGRMAQKAKLVDELGTWKDAYEAMKKDYNLKNISLFIVPKEKTWLEKLASGSIPEKLIGQSILRPGLYYLADIY